MSEYQLIQNCTVNDALGIAETSVYAFWEVTWWNISWVGRTKAQMVEASTSRRPTHLLKDRENTRHQKVVHLPSGEIVGYARWVISNSVSADQQWLEAQTPDVDPLEKAKFQKMHDDAVWSPREEPEVDGHCDGWRKTLSPSSPFLVLDYLACRPEHQRKGVANLLLESGMNMADQLKLPITILAMGNKPRDIYKKHGFVQMAENHQSLKPYADADYDTYWLVRESKEAQV